MLWSKFFIPTLREAPKDADTVSSKWMFRAGLIRKVASGLYDWLPLGLRVLKKAEQIVREEMNAAGGLEIWMPHIQPRELWTETGRWDIYGKELLRIKDRKGTDFCFAPTAEEVVTDLARRDVRSYKQLPIMFYQFGTKFRDEIRPRFGVMRAREFYMKDAYSFHADEKDAGNHYENMFQTYNRIFERCGFKFMPVDAESGAIGGSYSHEFMVLADTGEDAIVTCSADCGYAANEERYLKDKNPEKNSGTGAEENVSERGENFCPRCSRSGKEQPLRFSRGIEVGHTFKLGTKYSESMNASYLDETGASHSLIMGCYGIGMSRMVAAAIEQGHDANGIVWSKNFCPFQVLVLPINFEDGATRSASEKIYSELKGSGYDVLLDDRRDRPGIKFKDADMIGIPLRITVSEKTLAKGQVEFKERSAPEPRFVSLNDVLSETRSWFDK